MTLKSTGKKALRILGWILMVLFIFAIVLITTVDRSPIQDQNFFKETFERLDQTQLTGSTGEVWLGGWGKSNMTPDQPIDLVGYAPRGPYEFVEDSSYVKAITLSNSKTRIAWLSYELLIVHPYLSQKIKEGIQASQLPIDQVIFTATHTHAGMGGYMPGPVGTLAFGGIDDQVIDLMVEKSVSALKDAIASQDTVSVSYRKADAGALVANRFIKGAAIDPFVRQLIFTKSSGKKATFLTYSAHATCMSSKFMGLSGDYPSYLMEEMESGEFEFAVFAAGTVGSHRPLSPGNTPALVQRYAQSLDSTIQVNMTHFSEIDGKNIQFGSLPISLREPHLRISDNLRIRPWVFNYLLGETNPHFNITRIGSTLMIGSSGEISGVFYEKWEDLARKNGMDLIITSFNGGYIGYITPDELYDENFHEVRGTNWYGPGNGQYFDELITAIIKKSAH